MTVERRHHARQPLGAVVQLYRGGTGIDCTGVVDVGVGGIRLVLTGSEKPGRRVTLRIVVATLPEPIDVQGLVVWARSMPPHEVGVQFLDLDPNRLSDLL